VGVRVFSLLFYFVCLDVGVGVFHSSNLCLEKKETSSLGLISRTLKEKKSKIKNQKSKIKNQKSTKQKTQKKKKQKKKRKREKKRKEKKK